VCCRRNARSVARGDFITIPAGIPHWFKDVPSSAVTYYTVKVVKP
jgi:quercetin dioxygenase-like cupin family protein